MPPPEAGKVPRPPTRDSSAASVETGEGLTHLVPTRERAVKGAAHEADYWVPSDAYALANDFRREHMPSLPMEVFADLLLRLKLINQIN